MRRGDYRNYYKGHMNQIKGEGGGGGGSWAQLGWGGGIRRKGIQLYLNNYKNLKIYNNVQYTQNFAYFLPSSILKWLHKISSILYIFLNACCYDSCHNII